MGWTAVGICLLASLALTSAVCTTNSYPVVGNSHVSGGTQQNAISTLAGCQSTCDNSASCVSFDYVTASNQCWFLTDARLPITTETGTNHYNISNSCTTSNSACTYLYYGTYEFTNSAYYTTVTSNSLDACAEACNALGTQCAGVSYTPTTSTCKLATNVLAYSSMTSNTNYRSNRRITCSVLPPTTGCTDTFNRYNTSSTTGGTNDNSGTTVDLCKARCLANSLCTGIDYNHSEEPRGCYIHTNALTSRINSPSVTQYVRVKCTASCQNTWTPVNDISSPNGNQEPTTVNSEATCKAACAAVSTCLGFDLRGSTCWTHTDATNFQIKVPQAGVIQYTISRCTDGQTTTPSCEATYTKVDGFGTPNGVLQGNINTEAACKQACGLDSSCLGIDLNSARTECYFHTSSDFISRRRADPAATQYVLVSRCSVCVDSWAKTDNFHGLGGDQRSATYNTVALCQQKCVDTANCLAIDFVRQNTPAQPCWLHTTAGYTQQAETGTDHYVLNRCGTGTATASPTTDSGCQIAWSEQNNYNSPNGNEQTVTGLAACQAACISDSTCVALDFNTADNKCWFHTSSADLTQNNGQIGVNQYRLDRCKAACTPTYNKKTAKSSGNGVRQTSDVASTSAQCKITCAADTTCLAFDFDRSTNYCWFHSNAVNLQTERDTANIDQYVLVDRCPDGTTVTPTTRPGCQVVWTNSTGQKSNGAVQMSQYNGNLQQCLDRCNADQTCVAVDYDVTQSRCWWHNSAADIQTTVPDTNVRQYVIDRCFTGTTAPGCIIAWTNTTDMKKLGAVARSSYTTVDSCLIACIGDASCVAVDYDANAAVDKCWHHLIAANLQANSITASGVNHYVLDRCASTGTAAPPGCGAPTVTTQTNAHQAGGDPKGEYTSYDACARACAAQTTCLAFDYDSNAGNTACWFHTTAGSTGNMQNTNHYVITNRCPGSTAQCPIFKPYQNKHSSNGLQQQSITTQSGCQTACINNMNCQAYDFDSNINGCFLYLRTPPALSDMTGTTHYALVCRAGQTPPPNVGGTTAPACDPKWDIAINMHGQGGQQQTAINDIGTCLMECAKTASCYGVDIDKDPSRGLCWWHMSQTITLEPQTLTDHYKKVTGCTGGCTSSFPLTRAGAHGIGGTQASGVTTLSACQTFCSNRAACKSIDYGNSQCWYHDTLPTVISPDSNFNYYVIQRC